MRDGFVGKTDDSSSGVAVTERFRGPARRAQLLHAAAAQFAISGLRGTTTEVLAETGGIAKPALYYHFKDKQFLFRKAVEQNIDKRLRALEERLASVACNNLISWIEGMAEATVAVCVSETANAALTLWALLEAPDYSLDLHRNEVGRAGAMWQCQIAERFPESPERTMVSVHVIPYAVHACLAYGFWLAALRHTEQSAAPLAREFAAGVARAAPALVP